MLAGTAWVQTSQCNFVSYQRPTPPLSNCHSLEVTYGARRSVPLFNTDSTRIFSDGEFILPDDSDRNRSGHQLETKVLIPDVSSSASDSMIATDHRHEIDRIARLGDRSRSSCAAEISAER